MQLFPHVEETIEGTLEALRLRRRTCVSVVEACLRKIDESEDRIHAWVSVDRAGAIARARELDADLKAGRWQGPLHGIPLGIKDLIDVAGWPTGAGSRLMSKQPALHDAPLVARLRQAGAIILGKTVTTQFACFDPSETRNPWNLERTPGGSSSGSAAAVAAGMCLGAVGTQTGGSITRPASFCGLAGCKPTFGAIPIEGVFPVAKGLDHPGPIAPTVGDLAILLEVLAESAPLPRSVAAPPRLAILRGLFDEKLHPAMRDRFGATVRTLSAAGSRISDGCLPASFTDVLKSHRRIMLYEIARVHGERFAANRDDYLPAIRGLIEEGLSMPRAVYDEARAHQDRLQREIGASLDDVDALVCPATVGPAPDLSTTGDPSFNSPWSFTGQPTVSFPIGLSPDGLPLAMQLVGRRNGEAALFSAAGWCEQVVRQAQPATDE